MPLTRNDLSLSPFWTLNSLTAFLKQSMTQAGMSADPYDEFDDGSGDRYLVWERITDANKAYGKFYYVLWISGSEIRHAVCSTYGRDENSFPSDMEWSGGYSLNSSSAYTAISLRSDEANLVVFRSENTRFPKLLGWVRPSNRPVFWDENSAPYVFVQNQDSGEWLTTERNLYRFDNGESIQLGRFKANLGDPFPSTPNPINQKIDVLTGLYLYAEFSLGQGIVGVFSPDWGRATEQVSLPGLLIATSNGHQYVIFSPSPDNTIGAGVVRIV